MKHQIEIAYYSLVKPLPLWFFSKTWKWGLNIRRLKTLKITGFFQITRKLRRKSKFWKHISDREFNFLQFVLYVFFCETWSEESVDFWNFQIEITRKRLRILKSHKYIKCRELNSLSNGVLILFLNTE